MSAVLAVNAGSSSVKYAVLDRGERVASGRVERVTDPLAALDQVLRELAPHEARIGAVGHRIVHGGARHVRAERVTPALLADLEGLAPLDPDHLPAELALVRAFERRRPELPQVACFDTAFFADLPRVARLLPLPRRYDQQGIRRYGFHGLSYTWLTEELGRLDPVAARGRVVYAHLGSGASLAAVCRGRCLDTTMGFTPTSGLVMATRTGDLEPGVVLHLLRSGMTVDAVDALLNHESGLKGVSETSGDVRDLLAREAGDPRAAEALALFCHQVVKGVGAMAAALGGLDALVFSGGIGENAAAIRERVAAGLGWLGVELDPIRNAEHAPIVSTGRVGVRVVPTDEEAIVARQTLSALHPHPDPA